MKKLLLVGSASVHVLNFYHLVRDYFDEVLIVSSDNIYGDIPFRQVNFSIKNPVSVYANIQKLRKIITEFQPSIIHVHQANSVAWITIKAAASTKIPIVLTAWGDDILVHPHQNIILKKMVIRNLISATALTSDSVYMAGEMRKLVPGKNLNIVCANFGIETSETGHISKEKIVYSNRLHKSMYRIDTIIKAFARFHGTSEGSQWQLVIAGSGTETENLKNLVNALQISEYVFFKGWLSQEENRELYNKSMVYVSIPDSDATSISLLEALHAGCIPVVSDLPANREWITDGVNGIIVHDLNSDFISKSLQLNYSQLVSINNDLIKKLATKAVNKAKFIDIYNRLLS